MIGRKRSIRKSIRKYVSIFLSFALIFGMAASLPGLSAYAGSSKLRVIEEVEDLPPETAYQVVPYGTKIGELDLPDTLRVRVSVYDADGEKDEDEMTESSVKAAYTATPSDYRGNFVTDSGSAFETEREESGDTDFSYISVATPSDYKASSENYSDDESWIDVRVNWKIDETLSDFCEYDRYTPGIYTFTAEAKSASYEDAEDLAEIIVRVLSEEATAFNELIEALPSKEELLEMDTEEQQAVYGQFLDIIDALIEAGIIDDDLNILIDIGIDITKLTAIADFFAEVIDTDSDYTGIVYEDTEQNVTFGFVSTGGSTDVNLTDMTRKDSGGTITTDISAGRNKGTADTQTTFDENITVKVPESFTDGGITYTVTGYYGGNSYKRYGIKEIEWPKTLTSMTGGQNAFRYYQDLESLTIPGTVEAPEAGGYYSPSIKTLTLEEGVVTYNTNGASLWGKSALETVIFPETLTSIGDSTFNGAAYLTEVSLPKSLESLGSKAFEECTALTGIELPSGITEVPTYLFSKCTALKEVKFDAPVVTSIGKYAFRACSNLTFEEGVFQNVTEMGEYAFYGCSTLTKLDFPELEAIPDYAFYNCLALTDIGTGSALTNIGKNAFYGCTSITSMSLKDCDSLISIGDSAFYNCSSLTGTDTYVYKVKEDDSETGQYTLDSENGTETTYNAVFTIPDSVITIGTKAFYGTGSVTAFWVGSGIDATTENLFANNSNLKTVIFNNARENVTISAGSVPSSVTAYVWLEESIGDVGDTISEETGALTLQKAVNYIAGIYSLGDGETAWGIDKENSMITISKSIKLPEGLEIPAGCKVTITSGEAYTIEAASTASPAVNTLITVNEGAELILSGPITISGLFNSGSVASVKGTLSIGDEIIIRKASISSSSTGVIDAAGSDAVVNIFGGSIKENIITGYVSAVVRVTGGATVNMSGGEIRDNKETSGSSTSGSNSSAGVAVYDGTFNMSGGEISGNIGTYGGAAVKLYNPSSTTDTPVFNMSGGTISGNSCIDKANYTSGAVYIYGQSEFNMSGGEISGNTGSKGGGVSISSYWDGVNSGTGVKLSHAKFTMTGGKISGNTAASAGGGIYSFSQDVTLSGGYITGNSAGKMGGGIGSNGGVIIGEEVLSPVSVSVKKIWKDADGNQVTDTTYMPDVTVQLIGAGECGCEECTNSSCMCGSAVLDTAVLNESNNWSHTWTDLPSGDYSVLEAAVEGYTAYIYGLAMENSYEFNIENVPDGSLAVKKTLSGDGAESDKEFTFTVTLDNSANSDEKISGTYGDMEFTDGVAAFTLKGGESKTAASLPEGVTYIVTESDNAGYTVTKTVDGTAVSEAAGTIVSGKTSEVIFNNHKDDDGGGDIPEPEPTPEPEPEQETGSLTVKKTLSGTGASTSKAFTFTVTLSDTSISGTYEDMEFTDGVAAFTLKGGESKTATSLPEGVTYIVTESDNAGYTVTKTVDGTAVSEATGIIISGKTSEVIFNNYKESSGSGGGGSGGSGGGGGTGQGAYSTGGSSQSETAAAFEPIEAEGTSAQTGDTSHLDLWVLIMVLSALGMMGTGIVIKTLGRRKTA